MSNANAAPRVQSHRARLIAQTAATTANAAITEAPYDATVTGVTFAPDAAITGASSTKRTITLENRGQDGTGTTVIGTLDLTTGTNPAAFDEFAFTLHATAANRLVAADDVIAVKEAVTSTGTANPGGLVKVTFAGR
jgi:hypothetical protein